jgi:hypothetical protein
LGALDFLKKTPGILRMGALLLIGVFLLVYASSGAKKESADTKNDLESYGALMEERLEALCSQIDGVGRAEVMLTFESGALAEYRGSTQIGTSPPRVLGVTVLCTGGRDAEIRAELTGMLSALLGIGTSRISVLRLAE